MQICAFGFWQLVAERFFGENVATLCQNGEEEEEEELRSVDLID
jgi:hypothetical protein